MSVIAERNNGERESVSYDEAVKMLPDSERIHTFRASGVLIGADWDRADVLERITRFGVEKSGECATQMNHGLALEDDHGWLFIETKKP